MNCVNELILIKGECKDNITHYQFSGNKIQITYSNGKSYLYNRSFIEIVKVHQTSDHSRYVYTAPTGNVLDNISELYRFESSKGNYLRFIFKNRTFKTYHETSITITENVMNDKRVQSLFEYYKQCSANSNLRDSSGNVILSKVYERIENIGSDSVLDYYFSQKSAKVKGNRSDLIFPFGCNLSQISAVGNAFKSNISIIEGPPGTGKTQTILNIIANAVLNDNTVMVVSNNNSATDNVFEKLSKYGFGYIAARLGSGENKKDFIDNGQIPYPDFSGYPDIANENLLRNDIIQSLNDLRILFEMRNELAELERHTYELKLEKDHYLEYYNSNFDDPVLFKRDIPPSDKLTEFWTELQLLNEQGKVPGIFKRLKYRILYKLSNVKVLKTDPNRAIAYIKKLIYEKRITETSNEIQRIKKHLEDSDPESVSTRLYSASESLLKSKLKKRYSAKKERKIYDDTVWKHPTEFLSEYPVLLSTTFSARNCFKNIIYDYVIVDEASQVDLTCGVLAMSCAKNIVIVGDLKQLPNVVTPSDKDKLREIGNRLAVEEKYRCETNSLLSSACEVFPAAPRILLREHYRCHPKIIDFCNKKFYGAQLIIMTHDNNESGVIKAHITSAGNHARGHYNQRQIDEITQVILPELDSDDVGIIAPYNIQTSALIKEIGDRIPISTVHKFQGREKDDIIISTVDNEITEFTDDPNMLNVAVSRAKKRLRIVVSDNEANENTNIGDLIRYIRYNNLEVQHSKLYSVFDLLYKGFDEKRKEYLRSHKRISEYDSENLAFSLIDDILKDEKYSSLDVVSHFPLSMLIRDLSLLSKEETVYAMNHQTHLDFVIFSKTDKSLRFAIEVDGYAFHHSGTTQHERDELKDSIMQKYNIPLLRLSTVGSGERDKITGMIDKVMRK